MHDNDIVRDVVRFAAQQRAAEPDEPACAICRRFGEYICDATDEDVCSLECRDICTERHRQGVTEVNSTVANVPVSPGGTTSGVKRKMSDAENAMDSKGVEDTRKQEAARARAVAAEVRKRLHIHVEIIGGSAGGGEPPPLCDSFDSLPVELRKNMTARGFEYPTPVQMQTIPAALTGSHLLVSAPTGTGKTAAFMVPLLVLIMEVRFEAPTSKPLGLVLAPIRELAIQIEHEAKALMKGIAKMRTALVVGGMPLPPQLHRLRQGVQLVVATPGRLVDILNQHSDDDLEHVLDDVRCCVVDEVDMMLSVGFQESVTQTLTMLLTATPTLQLIITSATVSKHVEEVVASFLGPSKPFVRIRVGNHSVGGVNTSFSINPNVDHSLRWLEENDKKTELFRLLERRASQQTLVFVDSKVGADMLAQAIQKQVRLRAKSFHAGKSQHERLEILEAFVDEQVQVLVSTNVLGRGIDMLTVDSVVIFDAPKSPNDYVHLTGRVGRGNLADGAKLGSSVVFVNARDQALFADLAQAFRQCRINVPEELYRTLRSNLDSRQLRGGVSVAADDAKRAFRVVDELDRDDLSNRAIAWGAWKYSAKRSRYG